MLIKWSSFSSSQSSVCQELNSTPVDLYLSKVVCEEKQNQEQIISFHKCGYSLSQTVKLLCNFLYINSATRMDWIQRELIIHMSAPAWQTLQRIHTLAGSSDHEAEFYSRRSIWLLRVGRVEHWGRRKLMWFVTFEAVTPQPLCLARSIYHLKVRFTG